MPPPLLLLLLLRILLLPLLLLLRLLQALALQEDCSALHKALEVHHG
jgi:hypothetical protein